MLKLHTIRKIEIILQKKQASAMMKTLPKGAQFNSRRPYMKGKRAFAGHLMALLTVLVWGTTYVASDYLLDSYSALQILLLRFLLAYLVLWVLKPKFLRISSLKNELGMLALALSGVLAYYFFEARAIVHGGPTNTSILVSTVPMWTLLLLCLTTKQTMGLRHLLGFLVAISGVVLVVYNGAAITFTMNTTAVACALGACLCWAIYSRLINSFQKVDSILLTRRMLFYTLIFMVPLAVFLDGVPSLKPIWNLPGALSLALLGVFGSGICYVWWKAAIDRIGVVVTTNYVYLNPFVTMVVAVLLGREPLSVLGAVGAVMILAGILLSNKR